MKRVILPALLVFGAAVGGYFFYENRNRPEATDPPDPAPIVKRGTWEVPPPLAPPEEKPKAVSQEGIDYLQKLRTNRTPFGTTSFDLVGLRAGMGSRREPKNKDVKLIRVKVGEVPCEWVVAPGADPNLRLLYIHGGGFVSGSGGYYLTLAAHISAAANVPCCSPTIGSRRSTAFPPGSTTAFALTTG